MTYDFGKLAERLQKNDFFEQVVSSVETGDVIDDVNKNYAENHAAVTK